MFVIRKCLPQISRKLSTSALRPATSSYVAYNEPVYGYEKGTKERAELEEKLKEYTGTVQNVPIVVGGEEIFTNDPVYQVMPFDHQKKLAKYSYADASMIQKAIDVSQEVHGAWERTPLEERADIFLRAADLVSGKYRMDLIAATMLGQGKTIIQGEIDTACELADFYRFNVQFGLDLAKWQPLSTDASENRMILRGMEGFWAAIAPFNFTAISGHLAGAPAFMGNVVMWKPSNTGVLSSYIVFKILREAGVPAGVVNFLPSRGAVFGNTITKSPHLAGINFTGSVPTFHNLWEEVGRNISKYRGFPRLIGECGGKNFHFVHSSANLQSVVNGTIRSAFEYGGQKCSACSRMYVPESKWDTVKAGLVAAHKDIKLGSPLETDSFLSAVIDGKAYKRIKEYVEYAKSSPKIEVIAGGKCDDSVGYYVEPTIVLCEDPNDKIMNEEIFGPVLSIYKYKDQDYKETLKLIDETSEFGLTGSVYAEDPKIVEEASDMLRYSAGNFYVNDRSTGSVVSQQPFGGARKSGTNDKAGSPQYLLKFASPRSTKTTKVPETDWKYPYMS